MSSSRFQEGVWDAGIREAERHRRQKTRPRTALVVVAIVLFAGIGVFAYYYLFTTTFGKGSGLSYKIDLAFASSAQVGHAYVVNLTYTVSTGLATGDVRLYLDSAAGAPLPNASVPSACAAGSSFDQCLSGVQSTTGWTVELLTLEDDTLAGYPTQAGGTLWTEPTVPFGTGGSLVVFSSAPLVGTSDVLHVAPAGSSSVSGSYTF